MKTILEKALAFCGLAHHSDGQFEPRVEAWVAGHDSGHSECNMAWRSKIRETLDRHSALLTSGSPESVEMYPFYACICTVLEDMLKFSPLEGVQDALQDSKDSAISGEQ